MQGAREYVDIIQSGVRHGIVQNLTGYGWYKYKNLLMLIGSHARGKTLEISVVDIDKFNTARDIKFYSLNCEKLEVYGVVSGQRGWTEVYGWLHDGRWKDLFGEMLEEIKEKNEEARKLEELKYKEIKTLEKEIIKTKIERFNALC